MRQRDGILLIAILVVIAFAAWVVWPSNPGIHQEWKLIGLRIDRDIKVHQGLDLRGGMQVLLEADVPASREVTGDAMDAARGIVENRVNGLGVTEPVVQQVGERRILVQLPGVADPDQAVAALRGTGLLEFIDAGGTWLQDGTVVKTTFGQEEDKGAAGAAPSPTGAQTPAGATGTPGVTTTTAPTATPTATAAPATPTASPAASVTAGTPAATPTGGAAAAGTAKPSPTATPQERVFRTVLTGKDLKSAQVELDQLGKPEIAFELNPEGAKVFGEYTSQNVDRYLAIVMDKQVISCPVVQSPITEGRGVITGKFTLAEARGLVIQLKYGSLPIPLKIVEQRTVGPTLGEDSVARSVRAGAVGLVIVLLFMLIYYRLPGFLADLALVTYALVTFALFKLIPVTLTLPGVAGFLLSVGMAVDANILIFERMKEELRAGKSLRASIEAGFSRAWTSIRDSNLSTLITCVILFWFGSNYGASAVKGFAVTLFLGVVVSMFTAITVTRTFMRATFALTRESLRERPRLLGV